MAEPNEVEAIPTKPARTNWPATAMILAFLLNWCEAITLLSSFDMDSDIRMFFDLAIVFLCAGRWAFAAWRKEQSRQWIIYVILLVTAPPLWMAIEFVYNHFR
jgi:O-antigen ligase